MTGAAELIGTTWRWHRRSYMRHVATNCYSAAAVEISEMKNVHERFLNLRRLPGVLDDDEASVLLGNTPADISVLVSKSFFQSLRIKLAPNAFRRFSSPLVKKFSRDPNEVGKMHQLISRHWRFRNGTNTPKLKSVAEAA